MPPIKKGLEYFPLSNAIFENEDLVEIQNNYGPLGEVIYFRLLSLVFQNGYYYRFDSMDKLANKLIKSIGNRWASDKETVIEIIWCLAANNLFSRELMSENVISSREIQLRYLKAMERRRVRIIEYSLLGEDEAADAKGASGDNVAKTEDNVTKSTDNVTLSAENATLSPTKGREEKGSEEKKREANDGSPAPAVIDRDFLVGEFGEANVADYEARFERWRRGKVSLTVPKYETLRKWLLQDGASKPVSNSSFDVDETLRRIAERYDE